jgi:hypothetical protein
VSRRGLARLNAKRDANEFDLTTASGRYYARACGVDVPKRAAGAKPMEFWSQVQKGDGCWEWHGSVSSYGYGIYSTRGRRYRAHRWALEESIGRPLSDGAVVMHLCDNKRCVRPAHLQLGTHADNQQDKTVKGRQAKGSAVGTAKLTEADVALIRQKYRRGAKSGEWSSRWIADRYGIDQSNVRIIASGKHWRHVP